MAEELKFNVEDEVYYVLDGYSFSHNIVGRVVKTQKVGNRIHYHIRIGPGDFVYIFFSNEIVHANRTPDWEI